MVVADPAVIEIVIPAVIEVVPQEQEEALKPSEILRAFPRERWRRGMMRDAEGNMCALGILADAAGYDWTSHRVGAPAPVWQQIVARFGMSEFLLSWVVRVNDRRGAGIGVPCECSICQDMGIAYLAGLDGVITLLERHGW